MIDTYTETNYDRHCVYAKTWHVLAYTGRILSLVSSLKFLNLRQYYRNNRQNLELVETDLLENLNAILMIWYGNLILR